MSAYECGELEGRLKPWCALFLFRGKTSFMSYLHFIREYFNLPATLFIWGFLFVCKPERGEKNHSVFEEHF